MPGLAPKQKVRTGRVLPDFPNSPPVVEIIAYNSAAYAGEGEGGYVARATDPDQGDISANIVWESGTDGIVGSGPDAVLTFTTVTPHGLVAKVTDSFGATGESGVVNVVVGP